MKKETKKQLFAVIILLVFGMSSIFVAFVSFIPRTEQPEIQYSIDYPLSDQEEAYFLQNNIVVAKYFYSEDCLNCDSAEAMLDNTINYFNGRFFVEKIDADVFQNETQRLEITEFPTIYLKGNTIDIITEDITQNDLITRICILFFAYVEECQI